jgi:type II secretory pathway pseudopilin PulG
MVTLKREEGFTLFELVFTVGLLSTLMLIFALPLISNATAQGSFAEKQIRSELALARELASSNSGTIASGATIQFERASGGASTVVLVLANRPIAGSLGNAGRDNNKVRFLPGFQPVIINAHVSAVLADGSIAQAPFAIFLSSSGHQSVAQGDWKPQGDQNSASAYLFVEPSCDASLQIKTISGEKSLPVACQAN